MKRIRGPHGALSLPRLRLESGLFLPDQWKRLPSVRLRVDEAVASGSLMVGSTHRRNNAWGRIAGPRHCG